MQVITTELDHYSSAQMIRDFRYCYKWHKIDDLYDLFQTKCKNCGGDDCHVLQRQKKHRSEVNEGKEGNNINVNNNDDVQRTSTFAQINLNSMRLMRILDDYHCYFLHKIDDIQSELTDEDVI